MAGTFSSLPTAIQAAEQQNFLARWAEEGLDSELAYRAVCQEMIVNAGIGETITRTRKGRKAPPTASLNPATINSNIDNGFSANYGGYAIEQYTLTIYPEGDTADVNILQSTVLILDQLEAELRNNGVQAAQRLERLARLNLYGAYVSGNTYVRSDISGDTNTDTNIVVNDIRGFQTVLVNGVPTPVSGTNTLACVLTKLASGASITATVTAVTPDGTNASDTPDGISGQLTVSTLASSYSPLAGDVLIASSAPAIYRPNGKNSTCSLSIADVFSMQLLLAMRTGLRADAIPTLPDGTYLFIADMFTMQQLFADQDFKLLYQGSRTESDVFENGFVIKLLGVTFVETTEAYIELSSAATGSGAAGTNAAILPNSPTNKVLRPVMVGADAIVQGHYEMMTKYLEMQDGPNHKIMLINHVAQILRHQLDRFAQLMTASWFWGGGFTVPTDITATTTIIPTASSALYKRAAVAEIVA